MLGAFVEAIRATLQPCTVLLIVPIITAVLVAGARWRPTAAALAAAVVGGWLLASNRFVLDGWQLQLSAAIAAIALAVAAVASFDERLAAVRGDLILVPLTAGMTLLATMWWRPCVGNELGTVLTNAQTGLVGQLPGMAAYMLGAMVPVAMIALLVEIVRPPADKTALLGAVAAALATVLIGALALGRHDSVVVTLTRWTQT